MAPRTLFQKPLVRLSTAFVVWTLIALSFASQFYLSSIKAGRPVSWRQAVGWSLGDWYVWAVLSMPIVALARRFRFDAPRWGRSLAVHLVASGVFSFGYMVLRALLGQLQSRMAGVPVSFAEAFDPLVIKTLHFNLLIYWVIVSVSHAFFYYQEYEERAVRNAELERRLAQARLQALQMQLNPHFLFNTLHAISSLMHKNVDAADRMITRLAELLRYALDSTGDHEVPLRKELSFLERYLDIERTRFGSRLTVRVDVGEDAMDALVPNLILQPLVENAIKHGIEPHARPGLIELRGRAGGGRLQLEVRDNGAGLAVAAAPRRKGGIGLANTEARLQHLYGADHRFELGNAPEGGFRVAMELPLRTQPERRESRPGSPPASE